MTNTAKFERDLEAKYALMKPDSKVDAEHVAVSYDMKTLKITLPLGVDRSLSRGVKVYAVRQAGGDIGFGIEEYEGSPYRPQRVIRNDPYTNFPSRDIEIPASEIEIRGTLVIPKFKKMLSRAVLVTNANALLVSVEFVI